MMDIQKHTEIKPLNRMKIIYNDDIRIIDFLADLKCRRLLIVLDDFVREASNSGCLLYNCAEDDMVVLILHHDPFGFNENENHLVMYADNSLQNMAKYFRNQLEHTSPDAGDIYNAIDDITRLLYWRWCNSQDNDTQVNYLG